MCASCKCGCKPGKPAKGCDCQCKDCRAAREGVSKRSGRLVTAEEFSKKYDKYAAVNDAGMIPGAVGGMLVGERLGRRRGKLGLAAMLGGSLAGGLAGGAATAPIRRKMARKDREAAVGKSLVELSKSAKAGWKAE